ncbi:hypothetical protein D3H55_05370 [Bacillus salacetis]|uniref:Uncharacterized protein n=1 Tax=Bacillus salacetis TaxID=2315464 RepID=A0A3A1R640_9BACI|nr:hypothetical protein [Bacillus salacetis]RIW36340.1 hypothetical protein D3H55_05370 [Bacillus salacetis]
MEEQLQQTIKELEVSLRELENASSENVLVQHYIQEEKKEIQQLLERYYFQESIDPDISSELISYFWIGSGNHKEQDWLHYTKKSLY